MDAWFSIKTKAHLRIAEAQNLNIEVDFDAGHVTLSYFLKFENDTFSGNKIWNGLQEFKFNSKFVMDQKSVLSIHSEDNWWVIWMRHPLFFSKASNWNKVQGPRDFTWLYHEVSMSKVKKDSIARSKKNQTWNNEIHVWPFLGFWWVIIWQLVPF